MRRLLLALLAGLALAAPAPAQETRPVQGPPDLRQVQGPPAPTALPPRPRPPTAETLDYEAWGRIAQRAEALIAGGEASAVLLENVRTQIADWRAAFLSAQGANGARIATLRGQIDALGPPPAEGTSEAAEIAARRTDLTAQLLRLQAPVIAAEEAYSRADGLIREIDRLLRERQADALMRLLPTPLSPANWPEGAAAVYRLGLAIGTETARRAGDPAARSALADRTPTILGLLLLSAVLVLRGRRWFEQWPIRLYETASPRGREVWAMLASLGQVIVPTAGVYALAVALTQSGLFGPVGMALIRGLTPAGFAIFAARWLALHIFPKAHGSSGALRLPPEDRRRGRFAATALGILVALDGIRRAVLDPVNTPDAAQSVLAFPGLVLAALALYRLGTLLRRHVEADTATADASAFRDRLLGLLDRGTRIAAVAGPLLAAVGYIAAGTGLVYPTAVTLALVATLFLAQKLVADVFALVSGEGATRAALLPVLAGFALSLAAVPVLALIWGARWSDITEMLARAQQGFVIGQTRISPTAFLTFAVIFGLGFLVTRLLQGALKSTVLPTTRLDRGGQNAVVAGTGYLGIFLAALIAINAAGIDLSGLAIVAGALSVGIGFGLQTIVSNFVSGIILLVERPISEGDWIEVGPVSGIVKAISVRSTRIQTFDRSDVIVPNSDLITRQVTNWTRFSLTGRLVLPVSLGIGADMEAAERIMQEVAEAHPAVILNPPPLVVLQGFGANLLNYEVRVILRDVNLSPQVRTDMYRSMVRRFIADGILFVPGVPEMIIHRAPPKPSDPPKEPAP
jgi:small-conductance mechanosensitive channel